MKENFFSMVEQYPLESKQNFEERINSYIWNSIPEYGELWTAGGLKNKVEWDGTLKSFYGNTIVFPLSSQAISYVEEIQLKLNRSCGHFLAESLDKDTFHITLHDLVNGVDLARIEKSMRVKGFVARSILEQVKKLNLPAIRMESTCVFNMASTSVVLGMKPVDEESCRVLMMLYELFQVVVPLGYALTPHITLAYYKPGIYTAEMLAPLRELIADYNKKEKLVVELDGKELVYQEFYSMNHYVTI